jgi:hypothetical protein
MDDVCKTSKEYPQGGISCHGPIPLGGMASLPARLSKSLIKSLKHEMAFTLYTLGCDPVAVFEEPHVSRY